MNNAAELPPDFKGIGGYAPGNYTCKCRGCGKQIFGVDKRAWSCLHCAIQSAISKMTQDVDENKRLVCENESLKNAIKTIAKVAKE